MAGNGLDDDNNGFVDDVKGWDFVNDDNNPADDNGHGTQVGRHRRRGGVQQRHGIAGMCWNCRIMPVKVMQASGVANYSDVADGVLYAAQKGAKVINISLGGDGNSSALLSAIRTAVNEYGAIVVGGAGNDNVSAPFYPAAYEEVLAVAGTDEGDLKAGYSNYGSWVDLAAPGMNITRLPGRRLGSGQRLVLQAPFVSGLAGLIRSQHGDWPTALVQAQIDHTTDPIDVLNPAYAGQLGSGRINAAGCLPASSPESIAPIHGGRWRPSRPPTPGEAASLNVSLYNDWLAANSVTGTLSTRTLCPDWDGDVFLRRDCSGATGSNSPAFTFTIELAAGYNHPIPFNLSYRPTAARTW